MRSIPAIPPVRRTAALLGGASTEFSPLSLDPAFYWDASNYSASPTPHIPNALGSNPVDANILRGGNRMMARFTTASSGTLTIGAGTDHNSVASNANRFNFASGNGNLAQSITFSTAGTYTFSIWVKSNTGSSQSFRYGFSGGTLGATVQSSTATTSWQQFTHTVTPTAGQTSTVFFAWSPDGTTGLDVLIDDARIDAGASPGATQPLSGHMYLGLNGIASSGLPTVSAGKPCFAQFASNQSMSNPFTLVAFVKQTAAGSANGGIIGKHGSTYTQFQLGTVSSGPYFWYGYSSSRPSLPASLFDLNGQGYHLVWCSYNGSLIKLGVDDILIEQTEISVAAVNALDFALGEVNSAASLFYPGNMKYIAKYDEILTQANLKALREYGRGLGEAGSLDTVLVIEGDSISDYSFYNFIYPTKYVTSLPEKVYCICPATSGSTIATATAQRATWVDSVCASPGSDYSRRRILSIFLGANDALTYWSAQAWCDALEVYVNARKAAQNAGDKIIVCTLLPNQNPGFNARRNAINAILATWVGSGKCDALADFASEATVGVDAASANATYYPDGVHPSNATHTLLGPIHQAAVESVL